LAVAGAITATFLLFRGSWQDGPDEALRDLALWLALGSLAAFGVLAALLGRARRTAALLLLLLPLVELFWMGRQIYRFHPSAWHFPETPAVAFLRAQTGTFRIVGAGAAMFPSTAVFAGVDEIRTHDPMERRDYVALLDEAAGYPREHYFKMIRNLDAPILDLLNVRYLIAPPTTAAPSTRWRTVYESGDAVIFENASVLPRVFAPKAVTWIDAPPPEPFVRNALTRFGSAAGEMFANPDFRSRAWVTGPGPAPTLAPMEAVGYREGVNRASFHIEPPRRDGEGLLIASLLQDGGWRAHDERGRRLATALANGPFLAIRVPADASGVRLTYAPPGFRTGVVISLATLLVLATLGLLHLGRSVTRSVRRADPR
jgi:hypothetical protein